jgi:hypothetical protein
VSHAFGGSGIFGRLGARGAAQAGIVVVIWIVRGATPALIDRTGHVG